MEKLATCPTSFHYTEPTMFWPTLTLLVLGADVPHVEKPTLFNTKEADGVVSAMQIFPADNPWNADVSKWPLHKNSDAIVASIGKDKPLRCNSDMGYILVPSNQKLIEVKLVEYPDESDKGPYPVPSGITIEGWPRSYTTDQGAKTSPPLEDSQRD